MAQKVAAVQAAEHYAVILAFAKGRQLHLFIYLIAY